MNGVYTREAWRPQLPMLIAGTGVFLGVLFAKGLWIYAAALVGLIVLVLWPIEATLGAYAFVLPFDAISRLGNSPDGRTVTWYAGALTTVVLFGMALLHERFARLTRAAMYWLAFLSLSALSVFWALDENAVLSKLPTIVGLVGLYLAASCFRISQRQLARVTWLTVAGGVAASSFSISYFLAGVSTIEARSSLIAGTQQADPNIYAASLMLPLALAIATTISARRWSEKWMMAAASFIITVAVLLTMSRGAILALLAMGAVYLYRYKLSRWLLLSVPAVPLILFALPQLFFSRFRDALSTGGAGRLDIWTAGLTLFKHFGLLGAGLENFPVAYQQFAGFAPVFRGYDRPAHNVYLQVAVELGVLGIALLIAAVYSHIKELQTLQPSSGRGRPLPLIVACEAACVGMLVAAFFVGMLLQKSFWMVWIFCALATQIRTQPRVEAIPQRFHSGSFAYESPEL